MIRLLQACKINEILKSAKLDSFFFLKLYSAGGFKKKKNLVVVVVLVLVAGLREKLGIAAFQVASTERTKTPNFGNSIVLTDFG